ncbi:DUF4238 domain-containing protein [Bradyrhizobium vignae]|uniref:DUF4238 domain-containing protein n=1 Tax=Bradyrhizobium vignae TaxID=1549949 RepID=UPI00100AB37D|nr:DUF4238 domain-containing protein [Bradyrhizobium vignae]RXG97202.1 hypothetical protein EAV90_22830 [Bradyrhizobium vignae]
MPKHDLAVRRGPAVHPTRLFQQFYLRRWAGDDAKVREFSRPYKNKTYRQRVYPIQAGFKDWLYEKPGVPKSIAQGGDDKFMSPADDFLAKALDIIEADVEKIRNDAERRSVRSLFVMSLMRMPEDVAARPWSRRTMHHRCSRPTGHSPCPRRSANPDAT